MPHAPATAAAKDPAAAAGSTPFGAFFTLTTACAGAGILSLPYAVKLGGVAAGAGTLVVFAIATILTVFMMAAAVDQRRDEDPTWVRPRATYVDGGNKDETAHH